MTNLAPEPTRDLLHERELVDYESYLGRLHDWAINVGKQPETATGYAQSTVSRRISRIDKFYRWVWEDDGYTTAVTHDHADEYVQELALSDQSKNHKHNVVKALKMLFKWRSYEHGDDLWDSDIRFYGGDNASQPKDYLTRDERISLREAALSYGSVPNYSSLSPEGRTAWKRHLSQRFGLPMSEVSEPEFKQANGYKIPSLVCTSLDAGLRPVEVERATVQWVDVDNAVLRIPADESAKVEEHWVVSLRTETAEMLRRWLEERLLYDAYADRENLWLTREGNPYQTHSLKYLLERLCEEANIPMDNRDISWYAIRHSVGTYMTREEGLAAAASQLRHKSKYTTMKYDNAPVEDRRSALDRMG